MSPTAKVVLLVLFIAALLDISIVSIKLFPMLKRLKEIKRVRNDPDAISVEAEIIEIHTERLSDMDTEYRLKVFYTLGYQKFYKDIILINKQAVRVGMTITLLCDPSDPENAMIQENIETFGLKSMIFNITLAVLYVIVDVLLHLYELRG